MATLKTNNFDRWLNTEIVKSIKSKAIKSAVKSHFNGMIKSQVDASGASLPEKKDSTKKAYARKGYDIKNWFIRSGFSKDIIIDNIKNGIEINTADKGEILKFVKQYPDWFALNDEINNKIMNTIVGDITK